MTPVELEASVDRELARLPRPKAPPSLIPRILSAVRQSRQEPWHRRPWRAWPVTSRLAAGLLCVGLALVAPYAWGAIAAARPDVLVAAGAVWRIVVQPAAVYLAAIGAAMFVATAMCCAALALVLRQGGPSYEAL